MNDLISDKWRAGLHCFFTRHCCCSGREAPTFSLWWLRSGEWNRIKADRETDRGDTYRQLLAKLADSSPCFFSSLSISLSDWYCPLRDSEIRRCWFQSSWKSNELTTPFDSRMREEFRRRGAASPRLSLSLCISNFLFSPFSCLDDRLKSVAWSLIACTQDPKKEKRRTRWSFTGILVRIWSSAELRENCTWSLGCYIAFWY